MREFERGKAVEFERCRGWPSTLPVRTELLEKEKRT